MRMLGLALVIVAVVTAACGGSDGRGSEDAVRRDVERAAAIVFGFDDTGAFGNQTGLIEYEQYIALECRDEEDLAELSLGLGLLESLFGDADVRLEVTGVEFSSEDRALVTSRLLLNGEPADFFGQGDEEEEAILWIYQDGRWRSAEDCAFYGTAEDDGDGFFQIGTDDSEADTAEREAERSVVPGLTRQNPIPLAEATLMVDGWEIAVLGVRSGGATEDGNREVRVRVELAATYVGSGSASFSSFNVDAVGSSNVSSLSHCFFFDDDEIPSVEVFSGGRVEGEVCLVVTTADISTLVVFYDPTRDDEDRRWFATR